MAQFKMKRVAVVVLVLLFLLVVTKYVPSHVHHVLTGLNGNGELIAVSQKTRARVRNDVTSQLEDYLAQRAVKVSEVDCSKVLQGDAAELKRANETEHETIAFPTDTDIEQAAKNCNTFIEDYGFITKPLTELENSFPLAFSILTFKQAPQVVDLLRAVYRPQNFYCIHVDKKSPVDFRNALEAVSRCFDNVFMASRSVDVAWGYYSVLEPEIVCMEDLYKNKTWKYFINLTGQEFPLRTNYELVRILTAFKGANEIDGFKPDEYNQGRWKSVLPAPYGIQVYKGAVHITASRGFVDYVLHSKEAQAFLKWCQNTSHPDEHFFNSLNHNPHLGVPGSYTGHMADYENKQHLIKPFLNRYKNWVPSFPCPGNKIVSAICILSVLDLPILHGRREFFANKFYHDYSRIALKCLAEDLYNRTRDEALGRMEFNVSFYQNMPYLKHTI